MVIAAFVVPFLMPATVRFVLAAATSPDVRLGLITTAPADQVTAEPAHHLAGHWRVDDAASLVTCGSTPAEPAGRAPRRTRR